MRRGIKPFALHNIGAIQRRRFDINENLMRLRRDGIFDFADFQMLRAAEFFNVNCFHTKSKVQSLKSKAKNIADFGL